VLALVKSPEFQETPASRQLLEDLALQARARGALRADPRTAAIDIVVESQAARVRLKGIVVDEGEKSLCEAIVSALPGVKGVDNDLRTMAGGLYRFPSQLKD
jgi:osmotically-inducible protein OsmY